MIPSKQSELSADLRLVLETALDAVVVMNSDGGVVEWNDRAVETFGWLRSEALGRPLAQLMIPAAFQNAHNRGLQKFRETGEGPFLRKRVEVTGMRKSGEEFPVELSISPVEDGDTVLFVGRLRDISERNGPSTNRNYCWPNLITGSRIRCPWSVVSPRRRHAQASPFRNSAENSPTASRPWVVFMTCSWSAIGG